jgi:hypothetical protein
MPTRYRQCSQAGNILNLSISGCQTDPASCSVSVVSVTAQLCYYRYRIFPYVTSLNNLSNILHTFRGQQPHNAFTTSLQSHTQADAAMVRVRGEIQPVPCAGEISRINRTPHNLRCKKGERKTGWTGSLPTLPMG